MKKKGLFLFVIITVFFLVPSLSAQTSSDISSLKGMSFNGAAGLYTVPSGRIGWGRSADLAFDFGVSYNFFNYNPVAKLGVSLFKWVEITSAFDFQRHIDGWSAKDNGKHLNNTDIIIGLKVQLPFEKTAVALGGNVQLVNHGLEYYSGNLDDDFRLAGQIYAAATYPGNFFGMPAETSLALGYTFFKGSGSNIDYGMGFDLDLLPDIFQHYIHWIIDYSNFGYSIDSPPNESWPIGGGRNGNFNSHDGPWYRGILNIGLRIDLSVIPVFNKFKFSADIVATDVFDDEKNRSLVVGVVFGFPVK
jgi:hypothetical protein